MTDRIRRIFTATLIIGVSGAGKTSLLATFAEYLWETYQKILFLYSWDGGAIPTQIQRKMRQGLIRFWRVRTRSEGGLALETLYLATKGYLPAELNVETGETPPAVRMVGPLVTKYDATCPKGHHLHSVIAQSLLKPVLCKECNRLIQRPEMIVSEQVHQNKGFEAIGGVSYDGLSSMCGVVLEEMDRMRGHGLIGGEKSSFGGNVVSGTQRWGGNNRADVGFAQTRANQFVNNSLSIPNLVEGPVFTALSTEGEERGLPAVGINLPGQAAFGQAPAWFGNICEAGATVDSDGKSHFTLHVRPFTDSAGRRHLLKTSASPFGVPDQLVDPAENEGAPFSEFNLGRLFRLLDEDLANSLKADTTAGVPGGSAGVVQFGEAGATESSVPAESTGPATPAGAGPGTPAPAAPAAPKPAGGPPLARPIARPRAASKSTAAPTAAASPEGGGAVTVAAGGSTPTGAPASAASQTPAVPSAVPPPPGMKPPARMPAPAASAAPSTVQE